MALISSSVRMRSRSVSFALCRFMPMRQRARKVFVTFGLPVEYAPQGRECFIGLPGAVLVLDVIHKLGYILAPDRG